MYDGWVAKELQCRRARRDLGQPEKSRPHNLREADLPAGRGRHFRARRRSSTIVLRQTTNRGGPHEDRSSRFFLSLHARGHHRGRRQPGRACSCGFRRADMSGGANARRRRSHRSRRFVCPMSHGVCRPVRDSVLGKPLDSPADIARIAAEVEYNSMDLLQAAHTFSGVEMALWDVLGKARGAPVWKLLGYYALAQENALRVAALRRHAGGDAGGARQGASRQFHAPSNSAGARSVAAACRTMPTISRRRAKGSGRTASCSSTSARSGARTSRPPKARLPALEAAGALWLEEPFHAGALEAYGQLAKCEPEGENRRRRGRPQRFHGAPPHRLRRGRLTSRSIAAASAASARQRRWRTMRSSAA